LDAVAMQAIDLYHTSFPRIFDALQKGDSGILGKIRDSEIGRWLAINNVDWQTTLNNVGKFLGVTAAKVINRTSRTTVLVFINAFIILFSIFYFLRDGERILGRVRDSIPLSEEYKDLIAERFTSISRATVKGMFLIALLQSFLGTMTLWFFGVSGWLLWGVFMLVLAVIPFAGTGVVLIPTGLIKILSGEVWQGITIICISVFFISLIDNFLRPRLVGRDTGLHDLMVFFSSLGGISVFGPAGFIIGPLIAAIFLTILDMYRIEFQEHIAYPKSAVKTKKNKPS
jgi:predicted PurR-regulated permease PerM